MGEVEEENLEKIRKIRQTSKDQGEVRLGCFFLAVFMMYAVPGLLAVSVMRVEVLKGIHPRRPRFFDATIINMKTCKSIIRMHYFLLIY